MKKKLNKTKYLQILKVIWLDFVQKHCIEMFFLFLFSEWPPISWEMNNTDFVWIVSVLFPKINLVRAVTHIHRRLLFFTSAISIYFSIVSLLLNKILFFSYVLCSILPAIWFGFIDFPYGIASVEFNTKKWKCKKKTLVISPIIIEWLDLCTE